MRICGVVYDWYRYSEVEFPAVYALALRRLAQQRGFEIVREYTDRISVAPKSGFIRP